MKQPTMLEQFVNATRQVIAEDGLDTYLPTLLNLTRGDIVVLDDIPDDVDMEAAANHLVTRETKPGDEYLLAYRISATHFRVVQVMGGKRTHTDFSAAE